MKIGSLEKITEEDTSHKDGTKKRVMIRNGEVPHITQFAQAKFPNGTTAEKHSHPDMYEIFLVEDGEGQINVNGENYPLKKGSYVIVEPGETHEIIGHRELVLTYLGVLSE